MEAAWFRIPGAALLAQVNPLGAALWTCDAITIQEVIDAVSAGAAEPRAWDAVKNELQGPVGREFHIRRIATFVAGGLGDLYEHPITIGVDGTGSPPVRLYNGNHRVAAAAIIKPEAIDALVSYFDPNDIGVFLPGSVTIYPQG